MGGAAGLLEFYAENGPSGLGRYTLPKFSTHFGVEGYLVMLVGNGVPYRARHRASFRNSERGSATSRTTRRRVARA